jgi:hypothetical protein
LRSLLKALKIPDFPDKWWTDYNLISSGTSPNHRLRTQGQKRINDFRGCRPACHDFKPRSLSFSLSLCVALKSDNMSGESNGVESNKKKK